MADLDSAEACTNAYSDIEEDFFRVGDAMGSGITSEPAVDPEPVPTESLWSRLFGRPLRLPTEDLIPAPVRTRPPTERPAEENDEEWDWMLAVARARARHATQPGM
jgi:hypothetical protein